MASSVSCFVGARVDATKLGRSWGGGEGGGEEPLTQSSLVKEEYQKLSDAIENLLSIKFTVSVKRPQFKKNFPSICISLPFRAFVERH